MPDFLPELLPRVSVLPGDVTAGLHYSDRTAAVTSRVPPYTLAFYQRGRKQPNNGGPTLLLHYFPLFLPATPLSLFRTLRGLFELTRRPSRALDSSRVLLSDLQRSKGTVTGAILALMSWKCPIFCLNFCLVWAHCQETSRQACIIPIRTLP